MTAALPPCAVVIPSLGGDVDLVLDSLSHQTVAPAEVEVVGGVEPSGKARNLGVARTTAPVVVFVDDDAVLGGPEVLASLLRGLDDPGIAVAGAAKLLPPASSWFQRRVAREVPRIVHPPVDRVTESTPPTDRHGYTDVTTTCCAVRREVLESCGGFDEALVRGVDSELFYRLARRGHRLALVPGAWVYHPAPPTLGRLLAKHFRYGEGYAQEVQRHPELAAGRFLSTPAHAAGYLLVRSALAVPHAVLPYSRSEGSWRPGFKPLRALSSYAAAVGYVYGWYRRPLRPPVPGSRLRGAGR